MFGENIKKIRELKGLGVNELSRMSGVNASYISAMERGEKENPTITTLKKLADTLGVTIDELMKNEEITKEKIKEWDEKYTNLKEELSPYIIFNTPGEAVEFILSQKIIISDLKLNDMSDEDKINFANELYTMMKMLAPKYQK